MSSLLRSTKFVRYFTGAARTLILNSAKTAEVQLLVNPVTLCATNNVITRDYAMSKKSEILEPLLQKLDSEVKRYGRISKRDMDEIFDEIRAKQDLTSSQSLLVIRCCGELVPEELPEQRTLLVQKIWSVLTERGIPMDISHYNALLRVYIENEHPFSPAKFLEELEKKGLQPNRVTYQRLMWRYCRDGDMDGAMKVLEKMRELNMPVSEPVLNALVMGHAFHGDTDGAKAVLETMAGAGLQPSNRTYTLLACGYAKLGDMNGVENVIKLATEKDMYMTDKDIMDIIEHVAEGGHEDKVEQLFTHLQKGVGYNQDVYNLILKLINKGHEETAKKVMKTMLKSNNQEDTIFKGAFYVKQLLKMNKSPDDLIKSCRNLQEEGLIPNSLYIATETALRQGQTELALKLFKELQTDGHKIQSHYFWPLLAQKGKESDEEGLLQILREMHNARLPANGEALRDYVIPYLIEKDSPQNVILKLQIASIPAILSARNIMVHLLDLGHIKDAAEIALQYCPRGQYSLVARPLIQALSKTKDIDAFANILHVISSSPPQTDVESVIDEDQNYDKGDTNEVSRIVYSAVKILRTSELCNELLVTLHSKGLRINSESAESIEQFLGNNMTTNLAELLSKLTSPDLELAPVNAPKRSVVRNSSHLEKLLTKAKSQGGNVKRLQKQLLTLYMEEGKTDQVKSFVKELEATEFELNPVTLAILVEFYCANDDVDSAFEIKSKLNSKYPEFALNKLKYVEMAYALLRADRYDEALNILKENRPSSDDENLGYRYKAKCWQLLNSLAEKHDVTKVKEMTNVLIENNFIEPSNVLLGPSIKVHLLKEDIDGALKEFEYCCNQYRSTPWKGELMKALIMKEDASKLQWMADLSTQIHGEVNILHDLVLAFVECGRLRQARRILETPGLQTRQRRLQDACQRYVEEGKSEYLEGLLEATRELSHIDRANIYQHLLHTYCKANETDKALGLWTLLQEEGEVPSDEFLFILGNHLKAQGRNVPFVIPEGVTINKISTSEGKQNKAVKATSSQVNSQPSTSSKKEIADKIESLIHQGKSNEAMDYTLNVIENGEMPKSNILKYLLKSLAKEGEVEKIQLLNKYLNNTMRKELTYDDKLTLAIFTKGDAKGHVDNLLQNIEAANTKLELDEVLKKFPRSNALSSVMNNDEIISKCHKIAEIAASKDRTLPMNLLWMEYVLEGKEKEAETLWNQYLSKANSLVFRRLLQESFLRKEPQLIHKLIEGLQQNPNITKNSLGNAYSRLISYYLSENELQEAQVALEGALTKGVATENLNKNCIEKLKEAFQKAGKEWTYVN